MFTWHLLCVELALAAGDTVVNETDLVPDHMETAEYSEEDPQAKQPRNKSNITNCNTVWGLNERDLVVVTRETYFEKVKEGCEV